MKNIKSNRGITNMALITIVLVIIILMLLVAVIYLVKNPNTTYITQNLPTEQSQLSSTVTENNKETLKENIQVQNNVIANTVEIENQYEKLKGQYYGINNVYYDSADAEIPCEYKLYLKEDGTFDYHIVFDNDSGFCGNYIINGSEIVLNKLFSYGSDVGITSVSGQVKLKINSNRTITDSNKYYEEFSVKDIILTRKATEVTETLKLHIDSAIRDNAISAGN